MAGNRPRPISDTPMSSGSQPAFNVDLRWSQIGVLQIGDGNVVNLQCPRQLELGKISSASDKVPRIQGCFHCGAKRKQSTINFAKKKRKSNSKLISSSSGDELALTKPSPDLLEAIRGRKESLEKAFSIINQLHPLRDSGKWDEFQKIADSILLERKGDLGSELLVSFERSVVFSYQNDPDRSEAMLESDLKKLKESKFEDMYLFYFLMATAFIHQTGLNRRQNRHGDAEESLALARQNASAIKSGYLQAILAYESASNQSKYVSVLSSDKRRANLVNKAKNTMEECISICAQIDRHEHYIRKDHFGLTKLALVDLNCRTRMARSMPVKANCLNNARKYIECLEKYEHQGEISEGNRIQIWVAKSDFDFRLNNLQAAEVEAKRALEMAEKFGFSLEISPIKERLEDISQLIASQEQRSFAERTSTQWSVAQRAQSPSSSSSSPTSSRFPSSSDCEL